MSVPVTPVQLRRQENSQPWGFRLRGGTDQGIPLHVEHVNPKGRAVAQGLNAGDVIVSICGAPTQNMTHTQVKQEMLRAGNDLDLMVAKGAMTAALAQQQQQQQQHQPGGAMRGAAAPPPAQQEPQRVEVVEEPTQKIGGPTYKNVQTKTMQVLESELPQAESGGAKPASIFSRNKAERSGYLQAQGPTIQKAYGQSK